MPYQNDTGMNNRLTVLMSAYACEPGKGSEPDVGWQWACEMSKHHQVNVVTRSNNKPVIESYIANFPSSCESLTFKYFDLNSFYIKSKKRCNWLNWYYVIWQWKVRKVILNLVAESKVDLVHHVTFASYRYPVFLKKVGVPVIWGPIGGAEKAPWSLLMHGTRWRSCIKEGVRNFTTALSTRCVGMINPCTDSRGMVIASTQRTSHILKYKGIKNELMPTIGLRCVNETSSVSMPPIDNGLRLLFVGRLVVLKGVHLLIEALSGSEITDVSLTVVGDGKERGHLEKKARRMGVGDRVEFKGHVDKDRLPAVYANHHILVAPSLYESGGYTVLEAFMIQRPAIVTDVGGLAMSVNESCGIRVPTGSAKSVIEGLKKAIQFYQDSPELIAQHGAYGKTRCAEIYSWKSKGLRMAQLYEEAVSGAE